MDSNQYDYEIRVDGRLGAQWAQWFDGVKVSESAGQTVLLVPGEDPAVLYGVIAQIGALNLKLISIERIQPPSADG
jgi:hypothetical protein